MSLAIAIIVAAPIGLLAGHLYALHVIRVSRQLSGRDKI